MSWSVFSYVSLSCCVLCVPCFLFLCSMFYLHPALSGSGVYCRQHTCDWSHQRPHLNSALWITRVLSYLATDHTVLLMCACSGALLVFRLWVCFCLLCWSLFFWDFCPCGFLDCLPCLVCECLTLEFSSCFLATVCSKHSGPLGSCALSWISGDYELCVDCLIHFCLSVKKDTLNSTLIFLIVFFFSVCFWFQAHISGLTGRDMMNIWSPFFGQMRPKINWFGSDGVQHVWCEPSQNCHSEWIVLTVKHGGGSVIWGCMSAIAMTFIDGAMNGGGYTKILAGKMTPGLQKLGKINIPTWLESKAHCQNHLRF